MNKNMKWAIFFAGAVVLNGWLAHTAHDQRVRYAEMVAGTVASIVCLVFLRRWFRGESV